MPGNLFPLRGISHWEIYIIVSVWTSADFIFLTSFCPDPLQFVADFPNPCGRICAHQNKKQLARWAMRVLRPIKMKTRQGKGFLSFSAPALQEHPFIFPVPKSVPLEEAGQNIYAVILHTDSTHLLLSWNLSKDHLNWWHYFYGLQQALDQMNPAQYQHLRPQVGTSSKIFSKNFFT